MQQICLTRASTLTNITNLLDNLGAPVDRELMRCNLPSQSDQPSGYFVPVLQCIEFVQRMDRLEQIDDIIFQSFGIKPEPNLGLAPYSKGLPAVNVLELLSNFFRFVHWENPGFMFSIKREKSDAFIRIDVHELLRANDNHFSDWTIALQVVSILRACLGQSWNPTELYVSPKFNVCDDVREKFAGCPIHSGCGATIVIFPANHLLTRLPRQIQGRGSVHPQQRTGDAMDQDFPSSLELILRSYLLDGYPDINLAAEITGISTRTLQRRLSSHGLSYSEIVQRARYQVAASCLLQEGSKVIDAALAAGYKDASHFARAFRKIAGVSPSEFKRGKFSLQ